MKIKCIWENISSGVNRMKVIGGWIVTITVLNNDGVDCESSVFIPDANHDWEIDE